MARLAQQAESEPARVAAIKELLDRGFGGPNQPVRLIASLADLSVEGYERSKFL